MSYKNIGIFETEFASISCKTSQVIATFVKVKIEIKYGPPHTRGRHSNWIKDLKSDSDPPKPQITITERGSDTPSNY